MAFAEQYEVTGAGYTDVNGVYIYSASRSTANTQFWVKTDGSFYIRRITVMGPPGLVTFYKTNVNNEINTGTDIQGYQTNGFMPQSNTPYPDDATFTNGGGLFIEPVPTVTVYTGPALSFDIPASLQTAIFNRFKILNNTAVTEYLRLKNLGYF